LCRIRDARNVATMVDSANTTKNSRSEDRRRRQAAELRANLGKRKQQARARAETGRAPEHQDADNPNEKGG
jgi:hypothetical protein